MQVLTPIAGESPFFPKEDFYFPKPLIEVAGHPMIELVVGYLHRDLPEAHFVCVVDREDVRRFSIDRTIRLAVGDKVTVIERLGPTQGALCSCLLAVDALDPEAPLVICNSDQIIEDDLRQHLDRFAARAADAGVITFESVHPRWSYVLPGPDREVAQAFEKKVVSRQAIAGVYYFAKAGAFIAAAQQVILKDARTGGAFFISSALNEIILDGGRVVYSTINARAYHSFYAPARISQFEKTDLARRVRQRPRGETQVTVVIPASGQGSRFAQSGWTAPKPFIDVAGATMLDRVIDNVVSPQDRVSVLLRADHIAAHPQSVGRLRERGASIVPVARVTEGAACTVLLARAQIDTETPLVIANSDQLVDFSVEAYVEDCARRDLDGSILVFRAPDRDPKWSYARLDDEGLVIEVAEKKPISDLATVGIYLFARGRDFIGAAVDMISRNDRVNGEFYVCPVYNYLIQGGARIGVYEVSGTAMHGLGTPDDLRQYLAAQGRPPSSHDPVGGV